VNAKSAESEGAARTFSLMDDVSGDAWFDPQRKYRYWLERWWDTALPQFTYVLLNPSVATASKDDRTTRRLCSLTQAKGGGGYELVNLFALVDTHQEHLQKSIAVGESSEHSDAWIVRVVERANRLLRAGAMGTLRARQSKRANVPFIGGGAKSGRWSDSPIRSALAGTAVDHRSTRSPCGGSNPPRTTFPKTATCSLNQRSFSRRT
jgi:hypothetical protein